jgi:hypothetical protein
MRPQQIGFAALVACATMSSSGIAQSERPIYVQYEGFIRNADRTITLSFGYFNMNDRDAVVPAGDANGFSPAPVDRHQPVTFSRGRHRSACVIVMPVGFDGNLRWRVQHGGTVSVTTAMVLDPNYALEDASATLATNGLNVASAPRATCLQPQPLPTGR